MVVIMVSPAGREVNISMPTKATPNSASPTQTPVPSMRKRTKRKIAISCTSPMVPTPLFAVALIDHIGFDTVIAGKQYVD